MTQERIRKAREAREERQASDRAVAAALASRTGLNATCPACRAAPGEPCYEASAPGMTGAFTHLRRLGGVR